MTQLKHLATLAATLCLLAAASLPARADDPPPKPKSGPKSAQATAAPAKPVVTTPVDVDCKAGGGTGKAGEVGNGQQGAVVKGPVIPKCPGDIAVKAGKGN